MIHGKNCIVYVCTCKKLVPFEKLKKLIAEDPIIEAIVLDRMRSLLAANALLFEDKYISPEDAAFLRSFNKKKD